MDLEGILGDLLSLEVNTIIKDNMTAEKMPPLPFALHDIIDNYAQVLGEFGVGLEPYFEDDEDILWSQLVDLAGKHQPGARKRDEKTVAAPELVKSKEERAHDLIEAAQRAFEAVNGRPPAPEERDDLSNYLTDLWPVLEQGESTQPLGRFSMATVTNGWDSFERLRIAANEALDHSKKAPEVCKLAPGDKVLLRRIIANCSRLKFIVQGLQRRGPKRAAWAKLIPTTRNDLLLSDLHGQSVPLDTLRPEHQAAIRKVWEIGTERIIAQTCIQVDGDVLTRLSPTLLEEHDEQIRDRIMAVHRQSVDTSVSWWKLLVDVASSLVSGLFKRLGRGG